MANDKLSTVARTRLLQLLREAQPRYPRVLGGMSNEELLGGGPLPTFYEEARRTFLRDQGADLLADGYRDEKDVCYKLELDPLLGFLQVCVVYVYSLQQSGHWNWTTMQSDVFRERINAILADDRSSYRLNERAQVVVDSLNETEALRRAILLASDDAASCQQGDVQVEMVASTVQPRLGQPGCVLVDYGLGLGRVYAGLASAPKLSATTYIGVDEPIDQRARDVMTSPAARFLTRTEYVSTPVAADFVMIVNTLHHIPFREIPAQLGVIFRSLKPGGAVLIHEMGELREPEPINVPWRLEDIVTLLGGPAFEINPRSTVTRGKKVPLAHVLASVRDASLVDDALLANARLAWSRMKDRTLSDLADLYRTKDPERHLELQHALFVNANLDLNRPAG